MTFAAKSFLFLLLLAGKQVRASFTCRTNSIATCHSPVFYQQQASSTASYQNRRTLPLLFSSIEEPKKEVEKTEEAKLSEKVEEGAESRATNKDSEKEKYTSFEKTTTATIQKAFSTDNSTPAESPTSDVKSPSSAILEEEASILSMEKVEEVVSLVKAYPNDILSSLDTDIIKANALEGEVGERGEAWTLAWLGVAFCIFNGGIPNDFFNSIFTFMGGPGLMVAGGALILAAVGDIKSDSLTPFIAPLGGGSLITDGIYSKIRHPMYAGLIALSTGFSILTESATRLALTAVLISLLDAKSDKEEEMLVKKYPEYASYQISVPAKFFPWDWSL